MKKLSIIALSVFLFVACKEEESNPQIMTFSPTSGNIGDRVTITGTNFSPETYGNKVQFGNVEAEVVSVTPTELTVVIPNGATTNTVTVTLTANQKKTVSASPFTVTSGSWKKIADAPFIGERSSVVTFTVGQSAYFAFGQHTPIGGATVEAALWQYNQSTNTWTRKTPIASNYEQRYGSMGWAASNGKGYMLEPFGGTLNEYDPATDKWTQKKSMNAGAALVGVFSIGQYGYALLQDRTIQVYNPETNLWGILSVVAMPTDLDWVAAVGDKAYITTTTGGVYEFSPTVSPVITKIDTTIPASVPSNPELHGGTSQYPWAGDIHDYDRTFFRFDPGAGSWVQKARFIGPTRYWTVTFSIGTKFYAGLGVDVEKGYFVNDVYEYTPE